MTKHRPSWSKLRTALAALVCGSLLLGFSASAGAAAEKQSSTVKQSGKVKQPSKVKQTSKVKQPSKVKKSAGDKAVAKGKPGSKPKKSGKISPKAPAIMEIGQAEMAESEATGLHGLASFYGHGFQGRKTATGEIFDVKKFTAASNRFPLGSQVAVRRLDNDRCAIVKVNDRMHAKHRRRIIDVSRGTAEYLGMINAGVVMVRVMALNDENAANKASACQTAFEPEAQCVDCGRPPVLPLILDETLP